MRRLDSAAVPDGDGVSHGRHAMAKLGGRPHMAGRRGALPRVRDGLTWSTTRARESQVTCHALTASMPAATTAHMRSRCGSTGEMGTPHHARTAQREEWKMARGRPKTPIERMAARSPDGRTPGHRNLPAVVNHKPDHSIPVPRIDLKGRGEIEWENIWTAGWWLHRDQDYPWVEMICQAYMDIEDYRAYVLEHGLITKGYAGQDAANPMIAEIRKCEATIQKCLQVLGFSPTDRAKLMLDNAKAESALQQMIKAKRAAR